ncbi:hypothetical protein G7Y29_07120 [Corynebacterium qintianiae]|uniref:Uncharacterized protein n=1 Tax=Corynebacterium qintianiae TaxID=2709392 RepID=A0A7T0KM95_9CORY|nr:hypothetical protein [Corynebacterium qintianiae]QPK82654.1 hypothetical protein G7Y29_07120 [Corynebacterium qintianiae]
MPTVIATRAPHASVHTAAPLGDLSLSLVSRAGFHSGSHLWPSPAFGSSTAYITLSPQLACVLVDGQGCPASHQRIGAAGRSVHEAWNTAARTVVAEAVSDGRAEFWVRDARHVLGVDAPRGLQLREDGIAPAAWLSHPQLFSIVHSHFSHVMRPRHELGYVTRDFRELFVFDASARSLARRFPSGCAMRYSVGFPVVESN